MIIIMIIKSLCHNSLLVLCLLKEKEYDEAELTEALLLIKVTGNLFMLHVSVRPNEPSQPRKPLNPYL